MRNLEDGGPSYDVRSLAIELSRSLDRSNRVVERYLVHQVLHDGRTHGKVDAKALVGWMVMERVRPDCNGDVYQWAGVQLALAARNGIRVFTFKPPNGRARVYRWSIP